MTTFHKTIRRQGLTHSWDKCRATTLRGAKAECTRDYGNGWVDDTLCVGIADDDGYVEEVSNRGVSDRKWNDSDY